MNSLDMIDVDKISDTELILMQTIWQKKADCKFTDIITSLPRNLHWSAQMVQYTLNNLVKKGFLTKRKETQAHKKDSQFLYTAIISENEYQRRKTKTFVDKVFKGNIKSLVTALVNGEMDQDTIQELEIFWKKGRESE